MLPKDEKYDFNCPKWRASFPACKILSKVVEGRGAEVEIFAVLRTKNSI